MTSNLAGHSFNTVSPNSQPYKPAKERAWIKFVLIGIALAYLLLILFIHAINVFAQAFKEGVGPFFNNLTEPNFLHAVKLTVLIALIVVPVNTVFGLCAAWVIARHQF